MRRLLLVVLLLGLGQLCAYWQASSFAAIDSHFPSPQPDTKLYCQAARRIVEGCPFSYSEGEAVSTGTTSVLYPFLLAVPYACGATGDRLMLVGFFLNGLLYFVFLSGWMLVAVRWLAKPKERWLAVALVGLAAQPAACAFGQTDTGLWMAVSAAFAAALTWERNNWAVILLVIGPWVRPEGMVLVMACTAMTWVCMPRSRRHWVMAAMGGISSLAVFVFNWILTGRIQFDSVAHKGYFKTLPLADAVVMTLKDGMDLVHVFFVGTTQSWPQSMYFLPLLGGAFLTLGLVSYRWRRITSFAPAVLCLAVLGSLTLVASSGWQGVNFDRYLAWTMPVFLLFTAVGAVKAGRFPLLSRIRAVPVVLCLVFYVGTAIAGVAIVHMSSRQNASMDEFQRTCAQALDQADIEDPRHAPCSLGGITCTDAYDQSPRRFRHLAGIYSPDFLDYYKLPHTVELLKRRPDLRFDYWSLNGHESLCAYEQFDQVFGLQSLSGPGGRELRKADWRAFDVGAATPCPPVGRKLVARLDVGYLPDEKGCDYEVLDRWGRKPEEPFFVLASLNGAPAVDCARAIRGGDLFSVPLQQGRDCVVSVRALSRHGDFALKSPVRMLLQVDGRDLDPVQYELTATTNAFQEVSFTIPGASIVGSPCRIGLLGDHIVSGYWFWQ